MRKGVPLLLISLVVFYESQLSALPFVMPVLVTGKVRIVPFTAEFRSLPSDTQINLGVVFLCSGIKGTCQPNPCEAANMAV